MYYPVTKPKSEITKELGGNEVCLAFSVDKDAEYFHEWWEEEGIDSYAEYLANKRFNED